MEENKDNVQEVVSETASEKPVRLTKSGKPDMRGKSPEFLKYKGRIAEISANLTEEQRRDMKAKALRTRIQNRRNVSNIEDIKLWMWDILTQPKAGGCTAKKMMTNIDKALREYDPDRMSFREYVKLSMDVLKFLSQGVDKTAGRGNTVILNKIEAGNSGEVPVVKNVYELPEYQDKLKSIDLSVLDAMNTEDIEKFIEEPEEGENGED
jgi:hypothetical protein